MLRLVWQSIRTAPYAAAAHVVFAIASAAGVMVEPLALAYAVDAVIAGRPILPPVLLLAGVFAVGMLTRTTSGWAGSIVDIQATRLLRGQLLQKALRLGTPHRQPFAVGDLVSRVGMDSSQPGALLPIAVHLGLGAILGVAGFIAMAILDWPTALVLIAGAVTSALIVRTFVGGSAEPIARYQQHRGELATRLLDACRGARTIRASGTLDREADRVLRPLAGLRAAADDQWRAQKRLVFQISLMHPLLQAVILAVAGYRLAEGALTAGQLLAVLGYASIVLGMLDQVDSVGEALYVRAGAHRVREILDHPPALSTSLTPTRPLPIGAAPIVFDRVSLEPLLADVTLDIPAGSHVAVVGRSGSGKSALCSLAGRLSDPDTGRVLLHGVPLREADPTDLRHRLAYAFERPELFGATLGDAIAAGRPATPEQVSAAARAARADRFIECLPAGYATELADLTLSGGEVQRLGIARALLGDADVVILDDATSSVDTATEAELLGVLRAAWAGRTALMVAHRQVTAQAADLVLWLDSGRVRRAGTHTELWTDPDYRALFGHVVAEALR